jgi:hypothetical protein
MPKIIAIAAIGILPFLFNADEANAQGRNVSGDYLRCPVNTCSKGGGQRVKDINNCKASNCRKDGPK